MVKRIREQKGKITTEYAYNITSLNKQKASAKRLLELNRSHWEIENRLHWVRDEMLHLMKIEVKFAKRMVQR